MTQARTWGVAAGLIAAACIAGCAVTAGGTAGTQQTLAGDKAPPREIDTIEVRFVDGQLRERYEAYRDRNGQPVIHGRYAMWNESGVLLAEYECRHGKRHGLYRSYYPSGKIEAESHYVDDLQDGVAVWWYESGQRQREETWVRGVKSGKETLFYDNGKVKYEGGYDNGKPHGVFRRYYPNGQHEATGEYDHGKLLYENKEF